MVAHYHNGNTYTIEPITDYGEVYEDLLVVYNVVKRDTSVALYKDNMIKSIDQGLAKKVLKDVVKKGFVYCYVENNKYYGARIHLDTKVAMLLGLREVFEQIDYPSLEFIPHKGSLPMFRSIVTGASLRNYYNGVSRKLKIIKKEIVLKGMAMHNYLGIEPKCLR